jgi:tetratricopeptide (TPR) repeat protein
MKTAERHHLKHNEVADTLQDVFSRVEANRKIVLGLVLAVIVFGAVFGAWSYFRGQRNGKASVLLGEALIVSEAQVVAPVAPAPGQTLPPPPRNTFPTERAKLEAAYPKFLAAAEAYPDTQAGIAARYHAAATLAALGRLAEAKERYGQVVERDGRGLYGRMARLASAELNVLDKHYDPAIASLRELSLDTKGDLPVDAILIQLGKAYLAAGKKAEAQQTFQRIATEYAASPYAADARKQLDALKGGV